MCIEAVKNAVGIPFVADIHFDYTALRWPVRTQGRIRSASTPATSATDDRVKAVARACNAKEHPHPHRRERWQPGKSRSWPRYGAPDAGGHGGKRHVPCAPSGKARLQQHRHLHQDLSNVPRMMEAYRPAEPAVTDYPLHVGVTEAGTYQHGPAQEPAWALAACCWRASAIPSVFRWPPSRKRKWKPGYNILRAVGLPGGRPGGHHLPHLRPHPVPLHRHRQRGGRGAALQRLSRNPSRWP